MSGKKLHLKYLDATRVGKHKENLNGFKCIFHNIAVYLNGRNRSCYTVNLPLRLS